MANACIKALLCVICLLFVVQHQATSGEEQMTKNGMYLPVPYDTPQPPSYVCYHFRKICYVPRVSSGWRGWHREGFSGFVIHKSWMYYMNKVRCPCVFPQAPKPNGETGDNLLRRKM